MQRHPVLVTVFGRIFAFLVGFALPNYCIGIVTRLGSVTETTCRLQAIGIVGKSVSQLWYMGYAPLREMHRLILVLV